MERTSRSDKDVKKAEFWAAVVYGLPGILAAILGVASLLKRVTRRR